MRVKTELYSDIAIGRWRHAGMPRYGGMQCGNLHGNFGNLPLSATASPKPKPVESKPPSAIEIGQQRVARALRDPESARFSESFSSTSHAICGIVNAKNAMGGYAGARRFIATSDRVMVESETGVGADRKLTHLKPR